MSTFTKKGSKDETRIGDYAAKQPLSGTNVVPSIRIKAINGSAFTHNDEVKKAV